MTADKPMPQDPMQDPQRRGPTSQAGPGAEGSFRSELKRGEDVIDPMTFAGSLPQDRGIAPRVRISPTKWFNLLWLIPIGFVLLIVAVAVAKGIRGLPPVESFLKTYPGASKLPEGAPVGFPAWLGWQYFLNMFFLIFIIRSGAQILTDHPRLYWTRHSTPGRDWFRVQKPVPEDPLWTAKKDSISLPLQVGLPGLRHSIGLARWWHLGIRYGWSTESSFSCCCSRRASGCVWSR